MNRAATARPRRRPAGGWLEQVACRDEDPELFFPLPSEDEAPALAICTRCPVREDCQAMALAFDERYGVWGGVGETERRRLLDRRGAPAA